MNNPRDKEPSRRRPASAGPENGGAGNTKNTDYTMKKRIRISTDGKSLVHIEYHGHGYSTLCGLDGSDHAIDQITEGHPTGGKITCPDCKRIAAECRNWRSSDFA